jgi:chromosome condensin MukBEF ATPase and DNA-binding subunit MukB
MFELTKEVEGFKLSLRNQVEQVEQQRIHHQNQGENSSSSSSELELLKERLRKSEEERENEKLRAREQVESLEKQLQEIRKVLVPLLGGAGVGGSV